MVNHLEVAEDEALLRVLEYVGADAAKVERWYPYLLRNNDHVDQATLNVADKYEEKYDERSLKLALECHRLLQVLD